MTEIHETMVNLLFNIKVLNGDFEKAEKLIADAAKTGLFAEYISSCAYKPIWNKIEPKTFGN